MRRYKKRSRVLKDGLGEVKIPAGVYYGTQTARAVENFPISGIRFPRAFIRALGIIKFAACEANVALGLLDKTRGRAVSRAVLKVIEGELDSEFPLDVFQTGSGTSTNMNANEVIANVADEFLGRHRGRISIHPNDHVNMCQSSNDVIPSTIHIAAAMEIGERLIPSMLELRKTLKVKARKFYGVIKTGRTHLMDAVPIRLGQEFSGYAWQVEQAVGRIRFAAEALSELPIGGTAVGTGINAHPAFAKEVCKRISTFTKMKFSETHNHFAAQSALDAATFVSAALSTYATAFMKIANDIRLMLSGPRAGFFELQTPAVQPGSSIMPGKVNPVIAESVIQACAQVQGHNLTVALGNQWGNFELNTMMPVVAYNLLRSIDLLRAESKNFAERCVAGLNATNRAMEILKKSPMLATALVPAIGYDAAAEVAREAVVSGKSVNEIARSRLGLSDSQIKKLLDLKKMV